MTVILRDYQQEAVRAVRRRLAAHKSALVVLPTGSGKSLVAGALAVGEMSGPTLILAPTQELVGQDRDAVLRLDPSATVTTACAGLGHVDMSGTVIVGTPDTVAGRLDELPHHLSSVIVDEAHQVPMDPASRLRAIIGHVRRRNAFTTLTGLTATPYRLDTGRIDRSDLWAQIDFELPYRDLVRRGLLSPLVAPPVGSAITAMDTRGLSSTSGDFNAGEMEARYDTAELCASIAADTARLSADRKSILAFAVTVQHAHNLAAAFRAAGVGAEALDGTTHPLERARLIADFKAGRLRALVNVGVLTTGFDAPGVDVIVFARPTESPALFVQMTGRGTRISPATGKRDCLVLDFAGNFERLGPFDDPRIREKGERRSAKAGQTFAKACPHCREFIAAATIICPACGADLMPPDAKRSTALAALAARGITVLSGGSAPAAPPQMAPALPPDVFEVKAVDYGAHRGRNGAAPATLRINYWLKGRKKATAWWPIWHDGYAGQKGRARWRESLRDGAPLDIPADADEAARVAWDRLEVPKYVRIRPTPSGFDDIRPWSTPERGEQRA